MTTSSMLYCHDQRRILTPSDLLQVLGFGKWSDLSGLSHSQARDLVGECMGIQSVGVALLSLALSLPGVWERE